MQECARVCVCVSVFVCVCMCVVCVGVSVPDNLTFYLVVGVCRAPQYPGTFLSQTETPQHAAAAESGTQLLLVMTVLRSTSVTVRRKCLKQPLLLSALGEPLHSLTLDR